MPIIQRPVHEMDLQLKPHLVAVCMTRLLEVADTCRKAANDESEQPMILVGRLRGELTIAATEIESLIDSYMLNRSARLVGLTGGSL